MADHIVYRYIACRYMTGYENVTAGSTVSSASTSISITGADASGTDRIILAASSGAIDATGFQGSTSWSSDDADVTGEGLFAWANTDTGVGGGLSIGAGTLAAAGSSGTFTSTWASATKQANFSLSLVGTQLVELYDQSTGAGVDNVTCTAPIYGGGFYLLLFVQSVGNEEIATPAGGWVKVFSIGEGTGSGSTRITLFAVDADTVTDDTPTLTYDAAASVPELPARPPVYPPRNYRKPNLALAVASCVVPFVASIADLESETSWQPEYPDRIEPRKGGLNTGGSFAPAPDPIPDAPAPDFSWVPKYPDRIDRAYSRPIEGGCFRPTDAITAYYSDSTTGGGTSGSSDRTVTITPAIGDLICAFVSLSGNTNTSMTASDDQGGKYYLAGTGLWGTSANIGAVFVRTSLATTASAHVITVASGANTAGSLIAVTAKGMTRAGQNAVRSFGSQSDQASGTAAPVLNQAALFSNMTLVALASGDTTTTAPTDWTERLDTNQASPTTAIEVSTRDFGFEGTTATFGASTSTTFASFIMELDGSPLPAGDWYPSIPEFARGHRPRPHGGVVCPSIDTSSPVVTDIGWLPSIPDFAPGARRNPFGTQVYTFCTGGEAFTVGVAAVEQKIFGASPETGTWSTYGTNVTVTTVTNATDLFTANAHGMQTGDGPYRPSTTGTLPAGLTADTDYYIDVESANTFKLSTTAANAIAGTNVAISDDGTGTLTIVRAINTQPLGSCILTYAARGNWNLDGGTLPTDNKSNSFTAAESSPNFYASFPNSACGVWYKFGAAGGAAHTFSLAYAGFDEPTIGGLELFGVSRLQDSSHVERAVGSATITSNPVTTTARAILVAFIFGNGPVGQDHTWTFHNGFTKIPAASDEGDLSANGYIQVSVAYKVVDPGTYTFSASGIANEGGQMYLLAFQMVDSEPATIPWYRQPVDPVRRIRTALSFHVGTLDPPVPAVELSWQPEYPDRCPPARRNPFGGYVDPTCSDLPERFTWRPTFPDSAPGHRPRLPGGVFDVPRDDLDVPYRSWAPTYPDRAPGHRPRPHGGIVQPPQDTTTQPLCWRPEWPDFARGHLPRPRGGVVEALQDDDATPLAWSPTYPGILRRIVERLAGWSVLATDQIPAEETPVDYWWPSYPDRIATQQTRPAPSVVAPLEAVTGPTLNAWQAEYPDQVQRRLTRVESAIVESLEAATAAPSLTFWQPSYPDWFRLMSRTAVHVGPFFLELEWDRATRYGWHPTYPDRVDRKQPTLTRGYTLTIVPQDDESPELAWQPTYPDWFPPARLSYGDHWGTFHWLLATEEFVSVDVRTPTTAPFTPTRSIASLTETQSRCSNEGSSTLAQTATRSIASLTVSESRVDNMSYEIKTGDTSPTIRATLKDQDEAAVNITGATVTFRWRLKGASSWTTGSASIVSGADGTVSYQWTSGQTDTAGTYESEWKVTASGNTRTFPSNEYSLFYIRP